MSALNLHSEASASSPADPLAEAMALLRDIRSALERTILLDRLAVDAPALAVLLCISERSVWTLSSAGELPSPVKLGGRTVWPVETVRKHLAEMAARAARRK